MMKKWKEGADGMVEKWKDLAKICKMHIIASVAMQSEVKKTSLYSFPGLKHQNVYTCGSDKRK